MAIREQISFSIFMPPVILATLILFVIICLLHTESKKTNIKTSGKSLQFCFSIYFLASKYLK